MLSLLEPVLAQATGGFQAFPINWVAFAPEVVLTASLVVVILLDVFTERYDKGAVSTVAGLGFLGSAFALVMVVYTDNTTSMFGGAYVVDNYALVLKALFLATGYVVVLMSTNYIG